MEISESIWNDKNTIIPMAEVSHIVKEDFGIWVIFKHSKTNVSSKLKMKLEPAVWLESPSQFIKDYCFFRHEFDNVNTLTPTPHVS